MLMYLMVWIGVVEFVMLKFLKNEKMLEINEKEYLEEYLREFFLFWDRGR